MEQNKYAETVEDVIDSLDTLEEVLSPILSSPLPETLAKLPPLERAKLQTMLAYVTQDLVYMYLKTRGVNPLTHPVMKQMVSHTLLRPTDHVAQKLTQVEIKKYFDKIREAEDPAKRKLAVDKGAAKRFIMNAISMSREGEAGPSTTPGQALDSQVEQQRIGQESSEEEESESDGTGASEDEQGTDAQPTSLEAPSPVVTTGEKRKRPTALEVYAGYGDKATETPSLSKPSSKKKKGSER
ncbi:hypothetical protein FRB97_003242 [Tulasnella sp. 331]|nr:hypothetical protein FRB97_003242 [Tulasnella sp. 331]